MGGELWMKLEMLAMSVSSKTMEGMEEIRNVPISRCTGHGNWFFNNGDRVESNWNEDLEFSYRVFA